MYHNELNIRESVSSAFEIKATVMAIYYNQMLGGLKEKNGFNWRLLSKMGFELGISVVFKGFSANCATVRFV